MVENLDKLLALSPSLSLFLSLSLSLCLCLCLCLSVALYVCLSVCLSVSLSLNPYPKVAIHIPEFKISQYLFLFDILFYSI